MVKVLILKDAKPFQPYIKAGSYAGQDLVLDEKLGGYVVEVPKQSAKDLLINMPNEVKYAGEKDFIVITNRFKMEQKVFKGSVQKAEVDDDQKVDDLDDKTVDELKEMAAKLELKGLGNAKKDTLIEKIRAELGTGK